MSGNKSTSRTLISSSQARRKRNLPAALFYLDNALRRALDILISGAALILLAPLYFLIAFLIRRDSPGPVIYRGTRMGRNGKTFQILKFRTMYENDNSYAGPSVTAQDDPRVTPTGRWLRDTKINELPQLWNILRGEMSIVGPRPEAVDIANEWPPEVRDVLLSARPGLTSPASVLYRNEETLLKSQTVMDKYLLEILPTKLRLDYLYVRNRTLLTDLDIIFWTFVVLLPRLNNFAVPEHLLYWGPLSRFTSQVAVWFALDLIISFISVAIAGVLWRMGAPLDIGWDQAPLLAFGIAILFSLVNSIMGLNTVDWNKSSMGGGLDLAVSSGIVTLVLFVVNMLVPGGPLLPPGMLVVAGMLSFFGFVTLRYRSRLLTLLAGRWLRARTGQMGVLGERVLIVGAGEVGQFATWLLNNSGLARAFTIVGFVDDDPRRMGIQIDGIRVLGTTEDIPDLLQRHDIGLVMFAIANIESDDEERILRKCRARSVRLIQVADLMDSVRAHFPTTGETADLFNRVLANATRDKLTGAFNRNHFLKLVAQEMQRARRYGHSLSLVLFEVYSPNFPDLDDSPVVSAEVLRETGARALGSIREIDVLGRYGEYAFALLLPETEVEFAHMVANRVQSLVVGAPVFTDRGPIHLAMRYSVVQDGGGVTDAQELIDLARQDIPSDWVEVEL